jgi:hypothetical protein
MFTAHNAQEANQAINPSNHTLHSDDYRYGAIKPTTTAATSIVPTLLAATTI